MVYGYFKDLSKRTAADKVLRDKASNIAKNPKYDGYQRGHALMVYKFFDKKTSGGTVKSKHLLKEQLAEELHKPIIRIFKKQKAHSSFKDNIRSADLADMQLISKFHKRIRFSLCVIDIFSKYAWFFPLKDKKDVTITNAFQKILYEFRRKPNKIWADKAVNFIIDHWNHGYKKMI